MRKRYISLVMALVLLPMMMGAQTLKGSYFLDNSLLRNRLNPAFAPRANYFSIPVISNLGVGTYSNLGPADFLYPKNGELYTFLHQNVTIDEFDKNLPRKPSVDMEMDTDILSFGFFTAKDSFWSFDLGLKIDGQFGVPRDFLMLLKKGSPSVGQQHSLSGFNIYQTSSAYASIGHSRDFSWLVKGLKIGAKFRMYLPVEHVGMTLGDSYLTLDEDKWMAHTDAHGVIASTFMRVNPSAMSGNDEAPLFDVDPAKAGVAGFGFAFDLGAEYRLEIGSVIDGMTFSLSLLDLGSYFFSNKNVQTLVSQGEAAYEGFKDMELGGDMDLGEGTDAMTDEFMSLANFTEVTTAGGHSVSTGPKLFVGVEYPFLKDKMSAGLLYSAKFGYFKMMNELTLSYNLNPCRWFNLGLNWSMMNTAKSIGWVMELTPKKGVSFFVGSDYTFLEVMPDLLLPVDKFWMNARFGLSFMLGSQWR